MRRVALLVALVLAAPAHAVTVINSENPRYQRWVDEALTPTPDVTLTVIDAACPTHPETSCTWEGGYTIYLNPSKSGPRNSFFHEVGHNFDYYEMTDRFRERYGRFRSWDKEAFAESYALCAVQTDFRWEDDRVTGITAREQYRVCRLIRLATRHS